MIFSIDRDIFCKYLVIADSAVSQKNAQNILSNCLFVIDKNSLFIIGSDNDLTIKIKSDIISSDTFSFTSNAKRILSIVKEFPKDDVIVEIDDSFSLILKSKSKLLKGNYKVLGLSPDTYPEIKKIDYDSSFFINSSILKNAFKKIIFSASTDYVKPIFNGIYFIQENNSLSLVASDSRRLSLFVLNTDKEFPFKEGVIVPLKTIQEIMKINNSDDCFIVKNGNTISFKIGEYEIISRTIEGQYPNYKQVIPREFSSTLYVNKEVLMNTLRRISVFTKEPAYIMNLLLSNNTLKMQSQNTEYGEGFEEIPITCEGNESISIGINCQYMIDSIKEIELDTVLIGLTGEMSPVCIKNEKEDKSLSVIMPIQLKKA